MLIYFLEPTRVVTECSWLVSKHVCTAEALAYCLTCMNSEMSRVGVRQTCAVVQHTHQAVFLVVSLHCLDRSVVCAKRLMSNYTDSE